MIRSIASVLLFCALFLVALQSPVAAGGISIAWSPVGNAGNANDPATGNLYGGVGYNYSIGTYDVTNTQYVAFLNSNVPGGETADPLQLYNSNMSNATFGGINYTAGAASGSKYSVVPGDGNHPVNYETWYSAIRFANWLDNGQTPGSTETGSYTLMGGTPTPSNASSIARTTDARIVLPTENEWYKAAYYNPATNSYFQYATSSNATPTASGPSGLANHVNYNSAVGNLTDVGAYTLTTSPYGAFDMNGDVFQWNQTLIGSSRGARGGSFLDTSTGLLSSNRSNGNPAGENGSFGFRVAMVPEPGTGVLAVVAFGLMWVLRRRFK